MRASIAFVLACSATSAHAQDATPAAPGSDGVPPLPAGHDRAPGSGDDDGVEPPPAVDGAGQTQAEGAPLEPDEDFGPVLRIERIDISGNTDTQENVIRRALPVAPGDVLHATDKRLTNARFKVLALGFFRDVTIAMDKGSQRGNVIIRVEVVERGTFVLNRLWFGSTYASPYWFGTDVGDRNLFGLGISVGGGFIYAAQGEIEGARDQWAGELRLADGSLRGSRWGVHGALTLVHGSDFYRVAGTNSGDTENFRGFSYGRFGGRFGATYDITALMRVSLAGRIESIDTELPVAPTRVLPDGREVSVDLHVLPGDSRVATLGIGIDRDTRNDPILPHAGDRITASIEVGASVLASDYDFATFFGRYERWWPLRSERHAIGVRFAGGLVVGGAPRFDRIHISDVNRMLTPRALGLVLSSAAPLDILGTRADKPLYGELGGAASIEYAARLFRGSGRRRVYGGDVFVGAGVWGLAELDDPHAPDLGGWNTLPIDLYIDAGIRIDTDLGIFELTIANALGRLR